MWTLKIYGLETGLNVGPGYLLYLLSVFSLRVFLSLVYSCNPTTLEPEAGGSQVMDQPELHSALKVSIGRLYSEAMSQNPNQTKTITTKSVPIMMTLARKEIVFSLLL